MAPRYSRPVKALIATGIATSTIVLATLPAAAGTVRNSEWWMNSLGIRDAWPVSRGAGTTIAVLSDGVNRQQPDLTGPRIIAGPDYTGTGQSSGPYFGAVGTGIAALIAGHGYGLQGQSGILGEVPQAQILSVRVVLPPGDPLLTQAAVAARLPGAIAQGIRYAVAHGATVIDLPIDPGQPGPAGSGGAAAAAGGSPAEAAAVKYALSRNVVLVAPAGDDNLASDAPNYPAAYPGVIAVGAFDKGFAKAPWTSHQSYVTVTAAGSGMMVATNTGFHTTGSTTYASAVVAGIAAMLQGRFPGITVPEVRQALIAGTVFHGTRGRATGSGYGTVNAVRALAAADAELAQPGTMAGTGAQPLSAPAGQASQSSHQGLMQSIIRAGVVSAALLLVLLLLIAVYAARGRRRAARRRAAAAADWSRQPQARRPRAGGASAGGASVSQAEFFSAPVTGTTVADRRVGRAVRPPVADRAFAGAGRPAPLSRDPFGPDVMTPASAQAEGLEPRFGSPVGPASKAIARRPAVSGAPPWEEASPPEGELPWASPAGRSPAPDGAAGRPALPDEAVSPAAPPPMQHGQGSDLPSRTAQRPADPYQADTQRTQFRPAEYSVAEFSTPASSRAAGFQPDSYPAGTAGYADLSSSAGFAQPGQSLTGQSEPGRPGQSLTGRLEWGQGFDSAAHGSGFDPPGQSAGGQSAGGQSADGQSSAGPLPVRQPRHTAPRTALSPSGSLWERPSESADSAADSAADRQDAAGRPIYVWNPATGSDSYPSQPAELAADLAEWGLRARRERPSGY